MVNILDNIPDDANGNYVRTYLQVTQILRNLNDILRGSSGLINLAEFTNKGGATTPLSAAVLKRMGSGAEAESVRKVEGALMKLREEFPREHLAVCNVFVRSEAGDADYGWLKSKARDEEKHIITPRVRVNFIQPTPPWVGYGPMMADCDEGLRWLALYLVGEYLKVKWPNNATLAKDRDSLYEKVELVLSSYLADGEGAKWAVTHTVEFFEGMIAMSTAWKIYKTMNIVTKKAKK